MLALTLIGILGWLVEAPIYFWVILGVSAVFEISLMIL